MAKGPARRWPPSRRSSPSSARRMARQTLELLARWNRADDGSLRIDSEYLIVVARKRG